jgi:ribonuclease J
MENEENALENVIQEKKKTVNKRKNNFRKRVKKDNKIEITEKNEENNNENSNEKPRRKRKKVENKEEKTIDNLKINESSKKDKKTNRRASIKNGKRKEGFRFKSSPIKIIPLGGLLEIGKNITVFEYEDEIIIVDCGMAFPTADMLGVDFVIADMTYLEKNKDKIKGLVVTHGHEDHIGGIPYLLKQITVPIYATRFTMALIENKLEEHHLLRSTKLTVVETGQIVDLGKMKVEFIRTAHSIPDAVAFAIHTPIGNIIHTGDFKIDYTPIDGQQVDLGRFAELGKEGVLALMSDSTNAEKKGFTRSESTIGEVFDELFVNCKKRIVVATFSSNVHRVQQIINSSVRNGRKVAVCGRSMVKVIDTAVKLGYMEIPENTIIDIDLVHKYPDELLTIITTGSQGEPMSALTRMAAGEHRKVQITPNDLVIISATPIPGNEKYVSKVIDDLMKIGADVVYSSLQDIHVSGHASQEEQKLMMALTKPKYFIPVHGEYRQLMAHSDTAKLMGIEKENIFILENGKVLELNESEGKITGAVQSGKVLIDGLGIGDVGNIVLKDRQHLSQDGLIVVVIAMNSEGQLVSGPDIISRGFVYVRESENLMEELKRTVRDAIEDLENSGVKEWSIIKATIKDKIRDYLFKKNKRNPMILPIIIEA